MTVNKSLAYSSLKIFHHQEHLTALRLGRPVNPIHVQLVPTNRCNQACKGCAYRMPGYPSSETFEQQDEMPWSKLQEVVCDCKAMGVAAIQLTGGGEPTVHPHFLELCELILRKDIALGVVTNGAIWSDEHTDVLARSKWLRFSVDAGCASTYAKYRRSSEHAYEALRHNIRQVAMADRAPDCLIGVGFVLCKDNWWEVVQATSNAKQDGVDNCRISALFQNDGSNYFADFHEEARLLCHRAGALATSDFRVFNMFGDRISDLDQLSPDYSFCGISRLMPYLGADQQVYLCCMNAYNPRGALGEFETRSFRTMWTSPETISKLTGLDPGDCPRCMYNAKNRSIQYAMDPNPLHKGFI